MSTDTFVLLLIVWSFWIAYWLMCVVLRHTWTPMIPFAPLVLFGLGWLLNHVHLWVGTSTVAALHLAMIVQIARGAFGYRDRRR